MLGLGDALVNEIPTEDPVLMSETFRELYSEPDLLTSGSVDVEVEERTEIDFVVFGSSFVSVFENEKHLIALNFASSLTQVRILCVLTLKNIHLGQVIRGAQNPNKGSGSENQRGEGERASHDLRKSMLGSWNSAHQTGYPH